MAAAASRVMYFCVNCKNLLMKTNGERVLWKFYNRKGAQTRVNICSSLKQGATSDLNPKSHSEDLTVCEPPTWRTFMKDRRQSWSALWWSLWKTSGCSSSRMASTLLKNVMWFCCRNSFMFRWMRPCKRPAIIGRCLKKSTKEKQSACWTLSYGNRISGVCRSKILLHFFTWAKGRGAIQPASYMQGWHQTHGPQQTLSLLHLRAVWPGDAPGHQAEKNT